MANMQKNKTPVAEQEPKVRARNFKEVCLGYTPEEAMNEADRCLSCKNPLCVTGCPVGVRIPEFLAKVREGKFAEAYSVIRTANSLPAVSGRVCPQERQCESKCVRGKAGEPVAIGRLERFCADYAMAHPEETSSAAKPEPNGHKVAVIGGGPAGLTCAGDLAAKGYDVTVFEALHTAGGVLMYGIPEFRLPKDIVRREIYGLEKLGVKIMTNMVIGRGLSVIEACSKLTIGTLCYLRLIPLHIGSVLLFAFLKIVKSLAIGSGNGSDIKSRLHSSLDLKGINACIYKLRHMLDHAEVL